MSDSVPPMRPVVRPLLLLLANALVLAFFVACSPKSAVKTDASTDASSAALSTTELRTLEGQALFSKLCAVCHGEDGTGYRADNAPSLVNKTFLESVTDLQLKRSIAEGRPGTAMAGYGTEVGGPLDSAAIARIATWLQSKNATGAATLPAVGIGDVARGAPLYAANCERCHGTPPARGTAVHLFNPKFLEFSSDAFLQWAIVQGRPGTLMESWRARLTDPQIADVIAFLRSHDKTRPETLLPPPTGKEPIVINPTGKAPVFKLRADPCGPDPKCKPDERYVSVEQVKQAFEEKRRMVLIDARPPSDWMRVHIPGAVPIPYHDMKRLTEIPNDGTWAIAYCACPHHLSGDIVNELRRRGYKHAVVLDEGILEWHRRGYPVIAGPGILPPPKGPSAGMFGIPGLGNGGL
jgi:cytochrome c oxidase cbb3-type subunit III